jgi:hypothetical protein
MAGEIFLSAGMMVSFWKTTALLRSKMEKPSISVGLSNKLDKEPGRGSASQAVSPASCWCGGYGQKAVS